MKKVLAILALALLLSGCLQSEVTIYVNQDGSGVIEYSSIVSPEGMDPMMDPEEAADFSEGPQESDFEEMALAFGAGVELLDYSVETSESEVSFVAQFSFDSIEDLNVSPAGPGAGDDESLGGSFGFQFEPGNPALLTILAPDSGEGESTSPQEAAMMAGFVGPLLQGADISMYLVPGDSIVDTNALYLDGDEIVLVDVDFDDLLEDQELLVAFLSGQYAQYQREFEELGVLVESGTDIFVEFR